MSKNIVHRKGGSFEWGTPQDLFDLLDAEFDFVLDPAAADVSAKCPYYYTLHENGLVHNWVRYNRIWINPPYGVGVVEPWIEMAYQSYLLGALVVMLLPSRTSNIWWTDYISRATELRYIDGRVTYQGAKWSAGFPSVVVIYDPDQEPGQYGPVYGPTITVRHGKCEYIERT